MKIKKLVQRWLCIMLAVMMLLPVIQILPAEAQTKAAAPAYQGKWTYYAVGDTIYKLDSKSGTAKKVKQIKNAFSIGDVSYYNGYVYFTTNYYQGTDGSECYVCRMKTDGSGFEKLSRGTNPVIYDKQIYFLRIKHQVSEYNEYDDVMGIYRMSLNGKNSKLLVKNKKDQYMMWSLGVADGKVFYVSRSDTTGYTLMSYDLKKATKEKIYKSSDSLGLVDSDRSYLYLSIEEADKNTVIVYDLSTGKQYKKSVDNDVTVAGGRNGVLYFSRYTTNATYAFHAKKGTVTTVLKNKRVQGMTFSKYGYQVANVALTQEEFEASGYRYDMAIARVKLNGTGYKTLKKYYVS